MIVKFALVWLVFLGAKSAAGQSGPEDVVRAFFKAENDGRWLDAAGMLDLQRFEPIRQNMLQYSLRRPSFVPRTPEDLMKLQPDMPREVAEYQIKKMNEGIRDYDVLSREFAHVSSGDSLRALSTQEAAARWLEAKGPAWQAELASRESRSSSVAGCSGIPDSIKTRIFAELNSPVARVLGSTAGSGPVRYVVIGMDWSRMPMSPPADSSAGSGISPSVLTLRNVGGAWKIVPADDMPGSSRVGGSTFVMSCRSEPTGDSAPKK